MNRAEITELVEQGLARLSPEIRGHIRKKIRIESNHLIHLDETGGETREVFLILPEFNDSAYSIYFDPLERIFGLSMQLKEQIEMDLGHAGGFDEAVLKI